MTGEPAVEVVRILLAAEEVEGKLLLASLLAPNKLLEQVDEVSGALVEVILADGEVVDFFSDAKNVNREGLLLFSFTISSFSGGEDSPLTRSSGISIVDPEESNASCRRCVEPDETTSGETSSDETTSDETTSDETTSDVKTGRTS